MRIAVPLLVALAAVAAGLGAARIRGQDQDRPLDPRRGPSSRRITAAVWIGLGALGLLLLWLGWWAWGSPPAGSSGPAFASVAFSVAALELFFWGLLTPRVVRSERPPVTP